MFGRIELFKGLVKIKSDDEFRWGAKQQQAFNEIKEYLSKPPVLVPPQQDRSFYVQWRMHVGRQGGAETIEMLICVKI